ncbi:sensor histidine kinase [Clostridium oryzae]|uniref:histidine kinase n=1 Tax=Clostridium oryzae TaxID=1450648 RepID=A0A1V4IC57_9CLOT|nr:HAMP domain-containing sensor histidine kinase [Clostridium oryzae]OPJ57536.1 sensor histidine kinase CssS [Clostridium oryzae]
MKYNTIKWRIFKYNTLVIIMLIILTTIIFNMAVRIYFEKDIQDQLSKIANSTEDTALRHGPDFLSEPQSDIQPAPRNVQKVYNNEQQNGNISRFYFMLDRNLKNSLTLLNSDFLLLDKNKNIITPFPEDEYKASSNVSKKIIEKINDLKIPNQEEFVNLRLSNSEYVAIIKPVYDKNSFGLGWIIIYSSLQKVNQLQKTINILLSIILVFSAVIIGVFSSHISKKISTPFIYLNKYIKDIAARNFGDKIHITVDDELKEFVYNINIMSEKLETYDKAQKTFLQNASHEFRTPLMSIQSYAEGIKYNIIESEIAVDVILDETKRMTHLIEDLLYLSRLDAIEENYDFKAVNVHDLLTDCIERMDGIAIKNSISIIVNEKDQRTIICADEEKLNRAIVNIIGNCIRYAETNIIISVKYTGSDVIIEICDDGAGFDDNEIDNIFDRFYKGRKGNSGLGLSISKNVIEKHNGKITAKNSEIGASFIIELPAYYEKENKE